jgi:DNA gyrase subunit B
MYVGDTEDGSGMHQMLWAVVGNSVDEHLAGAASYVRVAFQDDGSVAVEDDGRGIPIGPVPFDPSMTTLEAVMTRLTAGGCGRGRGGIGAVVVNALSSRLEVEICRDGRRHVQRYAAGKALGPVRDLGATDRRGTRVSFTPDFSILRPRAWNRALVAGRLREIAALSPQLTIILDHRAFRCPAGLVDHVRFLGRGQRSLHGQPVHLHGARDGVGVDVALSWTAGAGTRVRGFVGDARVRRGTHLRGLARGLHEAFVAFDPGRFATVHAAALREVLRPGLMAAVQVTLDRPHFASWLLRDRLSSPEALPAVAAVVSEQLAVRLRDDRVLRERLLARMPR